MVLFNEMRLPVGERAGSVVAVQRRGRGRLRGAQVGNGDVVEALNEDEELMAHILRRNQQKSQISVKDAAASSATLRNNQPAIESLLT